MTETTDTPEFSTIKFFKSFERCIRSINVFPLSEPNLVVHKENYAALANQDNEFDGGFAHIGFDVPTGDTALLFSIDFFEVTCVFSMDGLPGVELFYADIDSDELQAAHKLTELVKAVANGQLFTVISCTEDNEQVQAIEIAYQQDSVTKIVMTYPAFDSKRKLKDREMTFFVHRNIFDVGESTIETTLLLDAVPPQEFKSFNRDVSGNALTPLTRDAWEAVVDKHYINSSDEYAADVIAKVDAWSRSGPQGSWKEIYLYYAEKRHINLTLYLMLANIILALGLGTGGSSVILMAIAIVVWGVSFSVRGHVTRHFIHKPLAYMSVIIALSNLYINQSNAFFYYVICLFVAVEVIECIVLDILEWRQTR